MPLLTVTNLTTGPLTIQDPSGYSAFSLNVAASSTSAATAVTLQQLAALEASLNKEQTAGKLTWVVADDPNSQADSPPDTMTTVLASPYNAVAGDEDIISNPTVSAAVSVVLSAAAPIGKRVTVIDGKGIGAVNNVTVTVAAGGTINGAASNVINTNYGKATYLKISSTAWLQVA